MIYLINLDLSDYDIMSQMKNYVKDEDFYVLSFLC